MDYDLELEKVVEETMKLGKKEPRICLQLPDGLKPDAGKVVDFITKRLKEKNLKPQVWLWASSNFGACDLPMQLKDKGFDLLVNFGHAVFRKVSNNSGK